MRSPLIVASLCLLAVSLPLEAKKSDNKTSANKSALKSEAVSIVKKFGGTLKPHLKGTMQSAGPVEAIKVCSIQAPSIAEQLSQETGWKVNRVSLKARNSSSASPDAWEANVLKQFDERHAKGESAKKMAYAEVVDGQFRFMKAQGVEKLCLTCHGEKITSEVQNALKLTYPDDMATGYKLGEIRGAFSLTKDLN